MKKAFKWLLFPLMGAMMLSSAACGGGGGKKEEKPSVKEKPILMFEIDEGIRNRELLGVYQNDFDGLHNALDNIFEATAPLKEKYDVRFHIYVHYHYKEEGFGKGDPSDPMNRISPVLHECLQYMEEKGESVYLEQISSGVHSHQHSKDNTGTEAIDSLPPVPVHYGDTNKVYGVSMDYEAIDAIAKEYESFAGLRFHEMVGSDTAYLESSTSTEAVMAAVDVCAANGKQLVWGDHSWDVIYTSPTVDEWKYRLEYARENLGKNLIVNFSNNSWDLVKSVNLKPMLQEEDFVGANFGFSVQAWFWQENDVASLNTEKKPKWYNTAYQDMPVELMAAFTLGGIEVGARLIQFEPPNYFFNYYYQGDTQNAENFTENGADYTGRITMARFIDLVMAETGDRIASRPDEFYTNREAQLDLNREEEPPKKYNQTTIGVLGDENAYFDVYNNDKMKVYRSKENRFLPTVTDGDLIGIERIALTFGCRDELLALKKTADGAVAEFYFYNSVCLYKDEVLFKDNANGTVVDFTTANILSEKVASLEGDPDEIIITREKNGVRSYEVYKAVTLNEAGTWWPFRYQYHGELEGAVSGANPFGYRMRNALKANETRVVDFVGYLTVNGNTLSVKLDAMQGKQEFSIETEIVAGGKIVDYVLADINLDIEDDIVLLIEKEDGTFALEVYKRNALAFVKQDKYAQTVDGKAEALFSMRTTTYYNKALAY